MGRMQYAPTSGPNDRIATMIRCDDEWGDVIPSPSSTSAPAPFTAWLRTRIIG